MKLRYFLLTVISFIVFAVSLAEMEFFYVLGLYPLTNLMAIPMAAGFYIFIVCLMGFVADKFLRFCIKHFYRRSGGE